MRYFPNSPARYLEPFCGSAALFFHLKPCQGILSDINSSLISFYKAIKRAPEEVYDRATSFPRTKRTYYELRDQFNSETEPINKAALFYYLNKNCFNGLYRTSKAGHFNVPFSRSRTGDYMAKEQFLAAANMLSRMQFECCDFESAVRRNCKKGDFVFLDPPYSDAKRYPFREYYPGCFSQTDLVRLTAVLGFIQRQHAFFVLTFSNRLRLDLPAYGWCQQSIRTRRNIAGFADARKYVNDLVITNIRVKQ